jgi:pyruvate dehydrogenase (quinone)
MTQINRARPDQPPHDPGAQDSSAPQKVSDYLLSRLRDWGISRVYGYSGDGINGFLGAFARAGNQPEFIQPPHEELCAIMAAAHAKYTGQVGVCLATQGPGAIHLLNGLYDAKLDHQPVVAIVGQIERSAGGSYFMQEVDLVSLFKDVAHEFVEVLSTPDQARHLLDGAIRIALSQRTVTALIVPHDVQKLDAVTQPAREHAKMSSAIGYKPPRVIPQESELDAAASVLNSGNRVAILAGAGALHAADELIAVAETLGAGVAKALLGKAALPDDLPFVTGTVGWLGTRASNWMMKECDTLLMVGTRFPYTEFLPKPGQARGVQIDVDGRALAIRYPVEIALAGDSRETLRALLPKLQRQAAREFRGRVEEQVRAWADEAAATAQRSADPIHPARVFSELSARAPADCLFCGDSGTTTFWFAQQVQMRRGMQASLSGTLATMGSGIPYALTAKLNYPERPVIAMVGDGAMQMNGINALIPVAQRWKAWKDPRFVVLVLNNRELNYVTWEQRAMEGDPKFPASQHLFDFPYARYAELLGLHALRVIAPAQVGAAWDEALSSRRPVLLEVVTDPAVPTLPPELEPKLKGKLEQALSQEPDAARLREQLGKAGHDA